MHQVSSGEVMYNYKAVCLGVVQNCYLSHELRTTGEEGQGHNTISKNVVMMQCKFDKGSFKINISQLLFLGLAQERLLCTSNNVDNYGWPLNHYGRPLNRVVLNVRILLLWRDLSGDMIQPLCPLINLHHTEICSITNSSNHVCMLLRVTHAHATPCYTW